jgi:hypothetical protein
MLSSSGWCLRPLTASSTTLPMPCEGGGAVRSGGRRQSRRLRIADGFAVCGFTLIGPLRTDERNFSADRCWREQDASKYEGKRHTDKSENKTVAEVLAIGFFVQALVDVRLVEQ